jgi:hypothetical protein
MESRVSLVFQHLPKGAKHHTDHNIDNGVIAVDKASRCMPAFVGAFDILSATHSCTTLQKHQRKHHVCHCSNGEFGNHDDPPRSIVSSHRRRRTFSLSDLGFLVKLDAIARAVSQQIHSSGALLSIRHGVCGGLMGLELTVAVGITMVGLVHRILLRPADT